MPEGDVVDIYNGILLSHKKKRNWVIFSDVDELRVCHTEWNKSVREKQILYANMESKKMLLMKLGRVQE